MLRNIVRLIVILVVVIVAAISCAYAQASGAPAVPAGFSLLIIIPYAIGMFLHWLKKYYLDKVAVPLFAWLFQNIQWTLGSLLVGWGAVISAYNFNPAAFPIENPGTWITVILLAMGADSINQAPALPPAQ